MFDNRVKNCICGAGPQHVHAVKQRPSASTHPWYIACSACGRVGQHEENRLEAVLRWNHNNLLYDAAEEPHPCDMTDR